MTDQSRRARIGSLFCTVILVAAALAPAQDKPPPVASLSHEQVRNEIARLRGEIAERRDSAKAPAEWKALRAAEARLAKVEEALRTENEALNREVWRLQDTNGARRWGKAIREMEERLGELDTEDRRFTRDAGRKVFQERHAELTKMAPVETPRLRGLGLDVLTYPRMDGSTSCQPLAVMIACRCFGAPYVWVGSRPRTPKEQSDEWSLREMLGWPEPELDLQEFTLQARSQSPEEYRLAHIINRLLASNASTHGAYLNLIEGKSEIGLLARPPSPDELELARKQNIELETVPFALDGFVFLVNVENSVRNLSSAQIRDILSDKIKNWKDVGGNEGRLTPYYREENSGSQQLMRDVVMKGLPVEMPKDEYGLRPQSVRYFMSGVFLELTKDPQGLAYSVYYYERFMSGSPLTRTIAVDGIEPTFDTIRNRKYPYTTEVYVVTRKGIPATDPAARLRDWLVSPEGQAVVRESGYVPIGAGN